MQPAGATMGLAVSGSCCVDRRTAGNGVQPAPGSKAAPAWPARTEAQRAQAPLRGSDGPAAAKGPTPLAWGTEALEATVEAARLQLPGASMSSWQRDWCTEATVDIYLSGRQGDTERAGDILARALAWRERFKDVLTGERVPNWQGDMRVLTRGASGRPIIYTCFRHQVPSASAVDLSQHTAAVFEAAVRLMMHGGATKMDVVADCHCFSLLNNLNVAPLLDFVEAIKNPYRDRLGHCWLVDAPVAMETTWRIVSPAIPVATRQKVRWISAAEVEGEVATTSGVEAGRAVVRAVAANRGELPSGDALRALWRFPSEVCDNDGSSSEETDLLRTRSLSRRALDLLLGDTSEQRTGFACMATVKRAIAICVVSMMLAWLWSFSQHPRHSRDSLQVAEDAPGP